MVTLCMWVASYRLLTVSNNNVPTFHKDNNAVTCSIHRRYIHITVSMSYKCIRSIVNTVCNRYIYIYIPEKERNTKTVPHFIPGIDYVIHCVV